MTDAFDGLPGVFLGALGQAVTITDGAGAVHAATGIFTNRPVLDLETVYSEPVLSVDDVTAELLVCDDAVSKVAIGGTEYRARSAHADGHGMVQFRLERI